MRSSRTNEVPNAEGDQDGKQKIMAWLQAHGCSRFVFGRSVGAVDEVAGERLQRAGGLGEGLESGKGVGDQGLGVLP